MAYQYYNANVVNPDTGEQGMWFYTGMTDVQLAVASISGGGRYREVEGDVPDVSDPTKDNTEAIQEIKAASSDNYPSREVDPASGMVQVVAQTAIYGDFGEVLAETPEGVKPKKAVPWGTLGLVVIGALVLTSQGKRKRIGE